METLGVSLARTRMNRTIGAVALSIPGQTLPSRAGLDRRNRRLRTTGGTGSPHAGLDQRGGRHEPCGRDLLRQGGAERCLEANGVGTTPPSKGRKRTKWHKQHNAKNNGG